MYAVLTVSLGLTQQYFHAYVPVNGLKKSKHILRMAMSQE